jgi:hypothetical protein
VPPTSPAMVLSIGLHLLAVRRSSRTTLDRFVRQ